MGKVRILEPKDLRLGQGVAGVSGGGDGSSVDPDFVEDFSTYTDTADLLSDPRDIYQEETDVSPEDIALDTGFGLDIDGFNLSQSMKYTFPDRTGEGGTGTSGRCGGYSIGRDIMIGDPGMPDIPDDPKEMWVEFYVFIEPGFTVEAPDSWDCTSNPDWKVFFTTFNGAGSPGTASQRYGTTFYSGGDNNPGLHSTPTDFDCNSHDIETGAGTWSSGCGLLEAGSVVPRGEWVRFRQHVKCPTTPDSDTDVDDGSCDGEFEYWLNDNWQGRGFNECTTAGTLRSWKLGANMNQGPDQVQSYWWGLIRAWGPGNDPGWERTFS